MSSIATAPGQRTPGPSVCGAEGGTSECLSPRHSDLSFSTGCLQRPHSSLQGLLESPGTVDRSAPCKCHHSLETRRAVQLRRGRKAFSVAPVFTVNTYPSPPREISSMQDAWRERFGIALSRNLQSCPTPEYAVYCMSINDANKAEE